MKTINILSSDTIDKIAAGEVIERPLSVVKELVENSIDAGSSAVTIEVKDGGQYIRITDNGEGIVRSEVKNAFMRHATSKIKSVEDLLTVSTLGFRGEALSSIASVARVEMLTKVKDDIFGTRYVIEGGKELVFEDAGIPDGTTIIVKDLFYNVPARRKFLKTNITETGYIAELIEHLILSHPDISFKFTVNGNVKIQSAGKGSLLECIYSIYGRDIANNLIEIESDNGDVRMYGYISTPALARGNKGFEIYFVNNRYIKSSIIEKALSQGYKDHLMLHKYPVVFLYFDIPQFMIDVNVHPAKKEIRFLEAEELYNFISSGVSNELKHKELIWAVEDKRAAKDERHSAGGKTVDKVDIIPEPFENAAIKNVVIKNLDDASNSQSELQHDRDKHSDDIKSVDQNGRYQNKINPTGSGEMVLHDVESSYAGSIPENLAVEKDSQLSFVNEKFLDENAVKKHRIIGQLFMTYWLIEYDNKLYIIDQHAAHEKVNYERLIKRMHDNEVMSQNIYPPIVVTLSSLEENFVKQNIDRFKDVGFTIEHFGGREYTISTVPLELLSQDATDYFHDMLDDIMSGKNNNDTDAVNLKIATMACKASVKGNTLMSIKEADELISELLTLDNPYNCPHGRPTIISYSKYEIEKMFKRIVS